MNLKMLEIAKNLVSINSVNTTVGEKEIGLYIEQYLRELPYFKEHPELVIVQKLKDDPLERRNVFALLIGEKEKCPDTILLHGHTDTVGIEDYGLLEEVACNPDELEKRLKEIPLPKEVREDLESGEYLFGRGACDMKSGDAVFLGLMEELSNHPETLRGNILVSFNPVEENLHTGIIEGLDTLLQLKETYGLEYKLAINNDYICPLYPGDTTKTIYTGTVGKLLPCFYIQGKETHVGQCFEGFDASFAAAKLVEKISLNTEFCDGYEGEYSLPPSVLKLKDLKPWYNVQTACDAFVYFNYFVHNASMEEITKKLVDAAKEAMKDTSRHVKEEARKFALLNGEEPKEYNIDYQVLTYEELCKELVESGSCTSGELKELVQQVTEDAIRKKVDQREIPIEIIKKLLTMGKRKDPSAILYYAAPYCPHNTLQNEETHYITEIEAIAKKVGDRKQEEYRMMKFFPSLSDSSYLKIDDSKESIDRLKNNFPAFDMLYPVPIETIQKLNIPAVNYGCYGKDAHKWTERVYMPYTFDVLPELILETISYYLM